MRLYEITGPEDNVLRWASINRTQLYKNHREIIAYLNLLRKPKNLSINPKQLKSRIIELITRFSYNVELVKIHCEYDMDKPSVKEYVQQTQSWLEKCLKEARELGIIKFKL